METPCLGLLQQARSSIISWDFNLLGSCCGLRDVGLKFYMGLIRICREF